jgi:hypothetical protein
MSIRFNKEFKTDDQRFVFLFSVETNDAGTEFLNLSEVAIFFQKAAPPHKKVLIFKQEDCPLNIPITFNIKENPECGNAVLYGKIFSYLREGNFCVNGDFYYGLSGQEIHFEGIMFILHLDQETPPGPGPDIDPH